MNILMVHSTHPATPHVSAVRAWRFARELAELGHRVVLLTATLDGEAVACEADPDRDWKQPLVLACAPAVRAASEIRWPTVLRRMRTALRMLWQGGEAGAWLRAAVTTGVRLPPACLPDVVWCTFGQMEAVFAARRIARRLRRPWVLDVKDNWELYVPRGLRRLMAWRIRGFVASTANAEVNRRMTQKWLRADSTVIYSGIEDCFLIQAESTPVADFEINLVGGIYLPDRFREFLRGISTWYRQLPERHRARVRFRYLGAQDELVRNTANELFPELPVELPGYVRVEEMAELCRRACVNSYIAYSVTFHHKLLELLACGRPVMAYPSEDDESLALADPVRGQLTVASTPAQVATLLAALSTAFFDMHEARAYSPAHLSRYAWPAQTLQLQHVLITVTHSRR